MQVSWGQLFVGVLLWSIVMLLPPLIAYFQPINPMVATLLLTTFYPVVISFMSRSGRFWISTKIILAASAIALTMSLLLTYVVKTNNKNILTFVPMSTFIFALAVLSTQMDMYNSNVAD